MGKFNIVLNKNDFQGNLLSLIQLFKGVHAAKPPLENVSDIGFISDDKLCVNHFFRVGI